MFCFLWGLGIVHPYGVVMVLPQFYRQSKALELNWPGIASYWKSVKTKKAETKKGKVSA